MGVTLLKIPLEYQFNASHEASTFIISVDASNAATYESNRGLPEVCERTRKANGIIRKLWLRSAVSVAMSRHVDCDALPSFLHSLGFVGHIFLSVDIRSLKLPGIFRLPTGKLFPTAVKYKNRDFNSCYEL